MATTLQETLRMQRFRLPIAFTLSTVLISSTTIDCCCVYAEARDVRATGEYKMGDGDTRTEAKRLALLDAKRLALEQIGTYVQSLVEVKDFNLTKEEINAYTAGIMEVVEQTVRDIWDGGNHVVYVDIIASIDPDMVATQISAYQENDRAKSELFKLRAEFERLQKEVADLKVQSELYSPNPEAIQHRSRTLDTMDAKEMLSKAWSLLMTWKLPVSDEAIVRAKSLAQSALALNPESSNAQYALGYIEYHKRHNLIAGEQHFRAAIRLEPSVSGYHFSLGQVLTDQNNLPEAIQEFEEAVRLEAPLSKRMSELTGIDFYRMALVQAHINWGRTLEAKGDLIASIKELSIAETLDPNNFGAHAFLAEVLQRTGDINHAIVHLLKAHEMYPTGSTHYQLGELYRLNGQSADAIMHYKKASSLVQGKLLVHTHNDLGLLFLKIGKFDEAIAEFREAISLKPGDPTLRNNLELAEAELKRRKE